MKNIVIIGGSSGISATLVNRLKANHKLYLFSRNNIDDMDVEHHVFDVMNDELDKDSLPEQIDGVVYAPGSIQLKPFHRFKETDFLEDMQINAFGAAKVLQACLAGMKKADSASVVLFSTVAVQMGMPFHSSIAMAKGAIEGLMRSLAAEWASAGIRVNAIAPSLTDTPLAGKLLSTEDKQEAASKRHPIGRYGEAKDVAATAAFLLSDDSSWMSGQILRPDGGMSSLRTF